MSHHTRHRSIDQPSGPGRTLRQVVTVVIALAAMMMAVPAASPAAAQDTPGTGAIEVHVSECPPGYAGDDLFNDCHANALTGVDVQISGASSDTKTTEGGTGAVRFANIPVGTYTIQVNLADEGQQYRTYCSLEGSDTRIPTENSNPISLDLADGQAIICDFYIIPAGDDAPTPPEELAQVTVNPVTCPEGSDPAAGFDALAAACTEPAENVTFTWGNESGPIESINTSDGDPTNGEDGQVVIDGIEPGTYTLYSDVPLAAADEVLYCVADGGNRYQKEFSENGITTFSDIQREQIVCDWFIVPVEAEADPTETPATQPTETPTDDDVRGVENGGSLVVHLALCPEGYDGDEIFDTCHGEGIADQEFVLTGPGGEMSAITTVPQTPGPGIVEFTELPAGEYTLAGGPPGDFGSVRLYCTTQPDGAFVETSLDSTRATFTIGEGEDILCDWYYIPENAQGETPTPVPTATPEPAARAEILVTLLACDPGETLAGASYGDYAEVCDEPRDGVTFNLGDAGAPPLSANTGVSGSGAVRFYDLLPGDYTLTPSLPEGLGNAAVFCQLDEGDRYQKTITNGSTTFVNVNGESITCEWFVTQAADPDPEPSGPSGSITLREFLCEGDQSEIEDWEQECTAGTTGATFTVASPDGAIELTSATNANGVATFSSLPDGFYTLKQNDGMWCKAKAERVDSQSRVIVEDGQNTDVFLYQCSQVTDLPSTGTGPGIGMIDSASWWESVSPTHLALMGVGALGAMLLVGWGLSRRLSA